MTAAEKRREYHLQRTYGMTGADYARLQTAQGSACAICQKKPRSPRRLQVDHDHRTGRVRGLLCGRCNRGLAYFQDEPVRFHRAALYLERSLLAAPLSESPLA